VRVVRVDLDERKIDLELLDKVSRTAKKTIVDDIKNKGKVKKEKSKKEKAVKEKVKKGKRKP
jgi:hypothetical protein